MTIRDPLPPVRRVMPIEHMYGNDPEDTKALRAMALDAEGYILSFPWCKLIDARYFGAGVGGVLAVFLFGILPARAGLDTWLWVIVGDVPPAYLVTDDCNTPSEALNGYIENMRAWVRLAKIGLSSLDVIPVNVPATPEWADKLQRRLDFLEDNIVPRFRDEEIERA